MVLVKPATVVQWHRQGWRLRSRSGRPSLDREVRDLIRQMNSANRTMRYVLHLQRAVEARNWAQPSDARQVHGAAGRNAFTAWRSSLRNGAIGIAAIDMFVAMSISFGLPYVMIILAHGRRKIVRFDLVQYRTAAWLSQNVIEAFPWETAPGFPLRDTEMPPAARSSVSGSRRWASRPHANRGRTLRSNAWSARSGEGAWTTSSS